MNTSWLLLFTLLGFLASVAVGDLVSQEIRGQLDALPRLVLLLASRRLPGHLRAERLDEWTGELHEILRGAEALPVTRLWRGLRYATGIVWAAPAVARALDTTERVAIRRRTTGELVRSGLRIAGYSVTGTAAFAFVGLFGAIAVAAVVVDSSSDGMLPRMLFGMAATNFFGALAVFVFARSDAVARAAARVAAFAVVGAVVDVAVDVGPAGFGVAASYAVGAAIGGTAVSFVARRLRAAVTSRRSRARPAGVDLPSARVVAT